MATLSWKLSTAPAQEPEYWLLFIDGFASTSLPQAPYKGVGSYSIDVTQLGALTSTLSDGKPHNYSVALVGQGSCGPQSAPVSITLPVPVATVAAAAQQLPSAVWPSADTLTST
jgi:hypothetical protein